ncbi:hypothetical protein [Spirosoma areae]
MASNRIRPLIPAYLASSANPDAGTRFVRKLLAAAFAGLTPPQYARYRLTPDNASMPYSPRLR